jgi:hypothetical protein
VRFVNYCYGTACFASPVTMNMDGVLASSDDGGGVQLRR